MIKSPISACEYSPSSAVVQFMHCRATAPQDYGSFQDNKSFLDVVGKLPGPTASWKLIEISVKGTLLQANGSPMEQTLDCWGRNPVDVVIDLLGNPEFVEDMEYAPYQEEVHQVLERLRRATSDAERERVIEEIGSAEWWPRVQVSYANSAC